MLILILIGFLGGLVTGISPCILPVLPVIFAAGAASGLETEPEGEGSTGATGDADPAATPEATTAEAATREDLPVPVLASAGGAPAGPHRAGGSDRAAVPAIGAAPVPLARNRLRAQAVRRRRPLAVVGGLVLSFAVCTLVGSWVLSALGLPQDLLRDIGLVVLGVVGLGLVVPQLGDLLERPFAGLAGTQHSEAGGFVLGLSLGLVFVPCAGPVLTAITVVAANHHFGLSSLVLTAAFALGVAVPLLIFAILGQRLAEHLRLVRSRAAVVRRVIGVLLMITALVIGVNWTDGLQQALPGYTNALQSSIEGNASADRALNGVKDLHPSGKLANCTDASPVLQECGTAPALTGISAWLNTTGGRPLSLAGLRGRVILVDFWTYSCINCQRTLPHLEAWNRAYAKDGLTIIGVHTPEFAFEHVESNVAAAAHQLGVTYPIAMDNGYATWDAYDNEYWPAEYLIDTSGQVRHVDFGEGQYGQTETFIRQLLAADKPSVALPNRTDVPDRTPDEQTTPETYLGYQHGTQDLVDQTVVEDRPTDYQLPSTLPLNGYAYGGHWTVGSEPSTAGADATLRLAYEARDVYLVLGGTGTITVSVNGAVTRTVTVSGEPKLYQLVGSSAATQGTLSLAVSPGIEAYDFTFG